MTVRSFGLAVVAAVMAVASLAAAPAQAQNGGVKAGVLTCDTAGGWGFIVGSSRSVNCTFSPDGGRIERYRGSITKIGVDIGYKGAGVMVWTVVAPTSSLAPGVLAGSYGGATASATVGVGVGANALIGGNAKQIALQPVSIEGQTGLNVAGGIGALNLDYIPGPYRD